MDQEKAFFAKLEESSIVSLDGIRAVAVTLVIYYHLDISPFFDGPSGVLIFFTLSGFLITWLLLKEYDRTGEISFQGFYKRRSLRIFPAFYCFWIFVIVTDTLRGKTIQWAQAWSSFFYVSNYHHAIWRPQPDYIMHTWSLGVEEQFYLLWPAVFLFWIKRGPRKLMYFLCTVIVSIWIYRPVHWLLLHNKNYLSYAFDARADALLVGCLLAVLLARRTSWQHLKPIFAMSPTTMALAFAALVWCNHALGNSFRFTIGLTLQAIVSAGWIGQLIYNSDTSYIGRALNTRVAKYVGTISYPLYLYGSVGATTSKYFHFLGFKLMFAALGAVAIASVSYWCIERPFLRLKNRPVREWFAQVPAALATQTAEPSS